MRWNGAWRVVLTCTAILVSGCRQSATLQPNERITRSSAVPATYSFELSANQFFKLAFNKQSTGVALTLRGPGQELRRVIACSSDGPIELLETAPATGKFSVEIRPCGSSVSGTYKIELILPDVVTDADRVRVSTERLVDEAERTIADYREDKRMNAVRLYEDALKSWSNIADKHREIDTLIRLSQLHTEMGESARADQLATDAQRLAHDSGFTEGESAALLALARNQFLQNKETMAVDSANSALTAARSIPNQRLEAQALYLLGFIWCESGKYEKASAALQESKTISVGRGDPLGMARAELYLAAVDFDSEHFDSARDKLQQVLPTFEAFGDKPGRSMALTYLAHSLAKLGRKQDALVLYNQALQSVDGSGDYFIEAILSNSVGFIHNEFGDPAGALSFLNRALENDERLGDALGKAYVLRSIGDCYLALKEYDKTLRYYAQANEIFTQAKHRSMTGYVQQYIGIALGEKGDRNEAIRHFQNSLQISKELSDLRMTGWALAGIGRMYELSGKTEAAITTYRQALPMYRNAGETAGELTVRYRIAWCLKQMGQFQEALEASDAVIRDIEQLRASVANEKLRTSYLASAGQQYELSIALKMQMAQHSGDPIMVARAFETSEQSRARSLLDSIVETRISIANGADPRMLDRQATLLSLIDSKNAEYTELRFNQGDPAKISRLSSEIDRMKAAADVLRGQIMSNPRYAALVQPEPLKLEQIQNKLLDNDTTLLEYSLGAEHSYVWAISKTSFSGYELPARSVIESSIKHFRSLITKPVPNQNSHSKSAGLSVDPAFEAAAAELSRMVLGPLENKLGTRRLVIVADGALQYVPFAVLPIKDPQKNGSSIPLLMRHVIVNLPSASTLSAIRDNDPLRIKTTRFLAILADPVYHSADERLLQAAVNTETTHSSTAAASRSKRTGNLLNLPRLPSTGKEADAIYEIMSKSTASPESFMDRLLRFVGIKSPKASLVLKAVGLDASKQAAMAEDLKDFKIIHIASHTALDDDHPDLSSLVLSLVDKQGNPRDGLLSLRDIYNLRLGAELVVLSACDTGIGKEIKGEGLTSLVRGFMYAGAPRVLASLWEVDDDSTAELMADFYRFLVEKHLSPAEAIREAQLVQMNKMPPYYWAAFQLYGDWSNGDFPQSKQVPN